MRLPPQRKEREKKKFEKEYLASLSGSVKDAKTADYISSRTVNGADVLDPTGRTFKIASSRRGSGLERRVATSSTR